MTAWRPASWPCCGAESEGWDSPPAASAGASSIQCQEKGPPRNRWGPRNQHPKLSGKTNRKRTGDALAKILDQQSLERDFNLKAEGPSGYVTKQYTDAISQISLLGWMEHEWQEGTGDSGATVTESGHLQKDLRQGPWFMQCVLTSLQGHPWQGPRSSLSEPGQCSLFRMHSPTYKMCLQFLLSPLETS